MAHTGMGYGLLGRDVAHTGMGYVWIIGKGCGSHRNVTRSFGHSVTVVQIIINRTYSINYKVDRAGNQVSKLQKNNHKQSERITMGSIKLSSAL